VLEPDAVTVAFYPGGSPDPMLVPRLYILRPPPETAPPSLQRRFDRDCEHQMDPKQWWALVCQNELRIVQDTNGTYHTTSNPKRRAMMRTARGTSVGLDADLGEG
jgi:hypothetical protein